MSTDRQFRLHAESLWGELDRMLDQSDLSDPEQTLRRSIAINIKGDFSSAEELTNAMIRLFEKHRGLIAAGLHEISQFIPRDVLVISDSRHAFEDREALLRMMATSAAITPPGGIFPEKPKPIV
jgi:hypothetical protein